MSCAEERITYRILQDRVAAEAEVTPLFRIGPRSGVLSLTRPLDYETDDQVRTGERDGQEGHGRGERARGSDRHSQ